MKVRFFPFLILNILAFQVIAQPVSRWSSLPSQSSYSLMGMKNDAPALSASIPPMNRDDRSPKRATIMSAMLPGLGQVYNEKYWKVGLIYVGGFAMGYGMNYNLDSLRQYQKALNTRVDADSATTDTWYPLLSDAKVTGERDYYRRNRDLLIIGFVALYALQIIDANVDAHLHEFDVNEDLSLKITPDLHLNRFGKMESGLTVRMRLK